MNPDIPVWVAKMLLARRRKKKRAAARKAERERALEKLERESPVDQEVLKRVDSVLHQVVGPALDTLRGVRDTIPLFGNKSDSGHDVSQEPECPQASKPGSSSQPSAEEPSENEADE